MEEKKENEKAVNGANGAADVDPPSWGKLTTINRKTHDSMHLTLEEYTFGR